MLSAPWVHLHRRKILAFAAGAFVAIRGAPCAAEFQPHSYPWLLSHATLVAAGTVTGLSGGLFGDGRTATMRVEGLIKGRWNRRELEVAWNDREFEETGYKRDARVIVFTVIRKDSTFAQAAPGISCWPVERIDFGGKPARVVAYAYPLELVTGIPASVLRTTESVETSMHFRMTKRNRWILIDALLPPVRPFVPAAPKPPRKPAPKRAAKASKRGKPASAK